MAFTAVSTRTVGPSSNEPCQYRWPFDPRLGQLATEYVSTHQSSGWRAITRASRPASSHPPRYATIGRPTRIAARLSTGGWASQCISRWYQASSARYAQAVPMMAPQSASAPGGRGGERPPGPPPCAGRGQRAQIPGCLAADQPDSHGKHPEGHGDAGRGEVVGQPRLIHTGRAGLDTEPGGVRRPFPGEI
jgi:hypothetical protein